MSASFKRFIHCADLHLESRMESHLTRFQAQTRRLELMHAFSLLADYAGRYDAIAVLISGDIFDTPCVSPTAARTFLQIIRDHSNIDFLCLPGNHDKELYTILTATEDLPDNFFLLMSNPEKSHDNHILSHVTYDDITIAGLTDSPDTLPVLPYDGINLVMLHGQLSDQISFGNDGSILTYPRRSLIERNIDYIAAGHIHSHYKEKLDDRTEFCHSGCLEGRGFDECGPKGFINLTITDHVEAVFQPFSSRTFEPPRLSLTDIKNDMELSETARELLANYESSSLIRLTLTGSCDPAFPLHPDWLTDRYSSVFYHFQLDKSQLKTEVSSPLKGDLSLRGEFIKQVMQDDKLSEEMKAHIIETGLLALSGEEVRFKL